MTQSYVVDVIEVETLEDEDGHPVVGKGKCEADLVYFKLDPSTGRDLDEARVKGKLVVMEHEIIGRAQLVDI